MALASRVPLHKGFVKFTVIVVVTSVTYQFPIVGRYLPARLSDVNEFYC